MKHAVLIGSLVGVVLTASLLAQGAKPTTPPAGEQKAAQTEKPATPKPVVKAEAPYTSPKAPNPQSTTAPDPAVSASEAALGSVNVPRRVMADGKALAPGTYQLRLTAEEAKPAAVGISRNAERWVEFVRGGKVVAREVASVIPETEIGLVAKGPRPRKGGNRVELLKGNDYLRIWVNRGDANYLIHLPTAA